MNHKHGMCGTPTWQSWQMMRRRCAGYTPTHKERYTDRGITVCERWQDFANFLADLGERPDGKTLDRIDNNLGYSPENCRWATSQEQRLNKSNTRWLTLNGVTKCARQWAKDLGLSQMTVLKRIKAGWPMEEVLSAKHFHEQKGRRRAPLAGAK